MTSDGSPPPPPPSVRVFVVSDPHAFSSDTIGRRGKDPPSYIDVVSVGNSVVDHPLAAIEGLVKAKGIQANILLCCGDLADRADPVGLKFSWEFLNRLKGLLGAKLLVTAVGNHDVDSRYQAKTYDAKEFVQNLTPTFPGETNAASNEFWARHFTLYRADGCRVLLVDSCAYHGVKGEHLHGRISDTVLADIDERLSVDGPCELNVLVCHHHPQKLTEYRLGDYDDMANGQPLLDLIGRGKHGDWLVVHGHKHRPKLSYASGGAASAVVMSCGSIGARLFPDLGASVRNQFYLLEFPIELFPDYGLVGRFTAWDWIPSHGCQAAKTTSGLPHTGGFGNRTPLPILACAARALFTKPTRLSWQSACALLPELQFVLPDDLRLLKELSRARHQVHIDFSELGSPREIELMTS